MRAEGLAWLSLLASSLVGEHVSVRALRRHDVMGVSGFGAGGWYIELAPELSAGDALKVLAHESGHLALGHIPRGVVSAPRPAAGSALRVWADRRDERLELEAQRWADEALARLSPEVRAMSLALMGDDGALRELVR